MLLALAAVACGKTQPRKPDSTAVANPVSAASRDTSATVTAKGFGAIHVGASVAQLSDAIKTAVPPARTADERNCRYVMLAALPSGTRVMMVNDSVARFDVDRAGVRTAEGAGVGDTEARVTQLYAGRVAVTPHKYTGPVGHYLTVSPAGDTLHRIIFETDGRAVLRYHAGRRPAVDFVEGCA